MLRYGRVLHITEERLQRAEAWFARYDQAVVLGGRMVPGARSIVSVPAGLVNMPLLRFMVLTTIGSALWNALLIGAGWALGHNRQAISNVLGRVSTSWSSSSRLPPSRSSPERGAVRTRSTGESSTG